jgi:RNA polymerase sigma-70 factor, ECF subfamily
MHLTQPTRRGSFPVKNPNQPFVMTTQESLADLLARCALSDRRAFETLYRQASPTLYGLLVRLVRDRELAADLLQEGFVRIWQRAGDYRPILGQPLTWMGTIVRHLAIDRLRRVDYRRRGELDDAGWEQLADAGPGPEDRLQTEHREATVARCLETLDPEPRQAVLLAYYEGLTQDVIAQRMNRPLGTVKAWVRRSLQRLKTCLGEP